jgi:hypothetical protein
LALATPFFQELARKELVNEQLARNFVRRELRDKVVARLAIDQNRPLRRAAQF